jgi:hypothetical protein
MAAVTARANGSSYVSESVRRSTAATRVGKGIRQHLPSPIDEPDEAL